jgi:hypothetical protein
VNQHDSIDSNALAALHGGTVDAGHWGGDAVFVRVRGGNVAESPTRWGRVACVRMHERVCVRVCVRRAFVCELVVRCECVCVCMLVLCLRMCVYVFVSANSGLSLGA